MNIVDKQERYNELLAQESDKPEKWFYVSFADGKKTKGTQFLGAIVVRGKGPMHAHQRSVALGINPGGEALFIPVPDNQVPRPEDTDRLLTRDEAENLLFLETEV